MISIERFRQLYAEAWKIKDANGTEFKRSRQAHREHLYYLLLDFYQRHKYKENI